MSANILTPDERQHLTTIPDEITEEDLSKHFVLDELERAQVMLGKQPGHRLDQAAHICTLRWLGWSPVQVDRLPDLAMAALKHQLGITKREHLELPVRRTSRLHAQQARELLGWRKYNQELRADAEAWLLPLAEEEDRGRFLLSALLKHLYQEKIVRPGLTSLERSVERVRNRTWQDTVQRITTQLSRTQKKQLDRLVAVEPGNTFSPFQALKETPPRASASTLLSALEKIKTMRSLAVDQLDLTTIHPKIIKRMARRAQRRSNWHAATLQPDQRHALLICFIDQALPSWIDQAVHLHHEVMRGVLQRGSEP